jgi:hypothetical protein
MRREGSHTFRGSAVAGALCLLTGCVEIVPPAFRDEQHVLPSCAADVDCGDDRCDLNLGLCVARMRKFPGLLLDVVPESVDSGFGGFHIKEELAKLAIDEAMPAVLELPQPPALVGRVGLFQEPSCIDEYPSVRVTFVPRLAHLGLAVGSYTTISTRTLAINSSVVTHKYTFDGIPLGTYDVYWQDAGEVSLANPGCEVVPQLFRNIENKGQIDLPLEQSTEMVHPLTVLIPWTDQLEGWTVDVVHAVTGEVLSTRRVLTPEVVRDVPNSSTSAREFAVELKVSDVRGVDYVKPSDAKLLRLSPPLGQTRPTISFSLLGLVVVTPDVAQLAPLSRFGELIEFKAWVWEDTELHRPVAGSVAFVAVELTDTQGQGRLEFSRTAPIDEQGRVRLSLPPGVYRARVRPRGGGISAFETLVKVWPSDSAEHPETQAAVVLSVPSGSALEGRVRVPYPLVSPEGTLIQALGLRSPALADPFRPRAASALATADGRFVLAGLDCGACVADSTVSFTVVAKPPSELGLPWSIQSRVTVPGESTVDFGLRFPAVHFGKLTFRKRNGTRGDFPGALIRALVLVDRDGNALPLGTPGCFEQSPEAAASEEPCASGTVEVAQARSWTDGTFRLLLPTDLAEFGRQ